jgi:hypothetical protein
MTDRVKMIAARGFVHQRRKLRTGEEFETDASNAADLESMRYATRQTTIADEAPTVAPGRYRRRDMRAEH